MVRERPAIVMNDCYKIKVCEKLVTTLVQQTEETCHSFNRQKRLVIVINDFVLKLESVKNEWPPHSTDRRVRCRDTHLISIMNDFVLKAFSHSLNIE